ncbi:MAG: DUF86 domain-containing protein [Nanoarchaeota archaeon]|nr:DUF86 domain-containing protein [Nanoarchaeota archaeon]
MNERINDKIIEIEKYLEELESVLPKNFEEYSSDWKIRDICERRFERIIEAVVDLGFLIIKERNLNTPEDDKNIFDILSNSSFISPELSEKLKNAKGMRNVIVHEYGKINDEWVFEAITKEIVKDVRDFLEALK